MLVNQALAHNACYHFFGNKPRAQNHRNFARAIAYRTLDTALAHATVQNQRDFIGKIVEHVLSGRGTYVAGYIRARRNNRHAYFF